MFADHTLKDLIPDQEVESEQMNEFMEKLEPWHVLVFATGSSQEPAAGFHLRPKLKFDHTKKKPGLPSASTCTNTLRLNVNEDTITDRFHALMVKALMTGAIFSKL